MVLAAEPPELFDRRTHGVVDRLGARLVDQGHAALVHVLLDEEIVVGARDDVDDGIADAENVVARRGAMDPLVAKGGSAAHYTVPSRGANASAIVPPLSQPLEWAERAPIPCACDAMSLP